MPAKILVVEDEEPISQLLAYNLQKEGFSVAVAADGDEALLAVDEDKPDMVLLDWMLPNVSGIELCRQIRTRNDTRDVPVIMLTARGEEEDRIRGLETGADDYLTKPFSPKELLARASAVLRRSRPSLESDQLAYADIDMDLAAHRVRRGGHPVKLGPTEYRLLRHLLERPGRVLSRQQLLEAVWPHSEEIELRTVDVHIRRLRVALGEPDIVRTVRSAGYSLDAEGIA